MLALAVLGCDDEALKILESQRDTAAREMCWVWIERHPAMQRLRREPSVQQLLTELRLVTRGARANRSGAPRRQVAAAHRAVDAGSLCADRGGSIAS
jgi:hypothetical protein